MKISNEGFKILDPEELYVFDLSVGALPLAHKPLYRYWFPNAKRAVRWIGFRVDTPLVERDGFVFYNRSESAQSVVYVYATIGDDETWVKSPDYKWIKINEVEL